MVSRSGWDWKHTRTCVGVWLVARARLGNQDQICLISRCCGYQSCKFGSQNSDNLTEQCPNKKRSVMPIISKSALVSRCDVGGWYKVRLSWVRSLMPPLIFSPGKLLPPPYMVVIINWFNRLTSYNKLRVQFANTGLTNETWSWHYQDDNLMSLAILNSINPHPKITLVSISRCQCQNIDC